MRFGIVIHCANVNDSFTVRPKRFENRSLAQYMEKMDEVRDSQIHYSLQKDLVQHILTNRRGRE